ncbi:MAG TPA: Gfo/Idh/MocA family oxidoreductase [Planctomycetota bacterium]|nr:Gfo/Idh/MocA family oxidoreductase [Planctomycetota bacterium]
MSDAPKPTPSAESSRRDFLSASSAAVAGAALASSIASRAYAAGDDVIKVGLIGCGGRGTGAAEQALNADKNVKLVAMGDTFSDRLEGSLSNLKKCSAGSKVDVAPDKKFVGFDCYKQVIDSGVDVVLLASPPHFRPAHLKYAVEKGKHVFAEKPVAVDGPGVRSVLATCEEAKKKNLSIVSGLCWRYHNPKRETIARCQDGAIGDILIMQCTYNSGPLWMHPRKPDWSDMEWQVRNWTYFTWLAGDLITEQHIHSIDKAAWVMKDTYPVKATGTGGRQVRTGKEYGHIYDHFSTVFEFANGAKCFSNCRQMAGCDNDITDHFYGTKGRCDVFKHQIIGENAWKYSGKDNNMYQTEHDELFASIRAGKPINNGDYMAKSSLMAIMGRMSAYTGKTITWDMALNSKEDLSPPKYEWCSIETPPVPMPGQTKFL